MFKISPGGSDPDALAGGTVAAVGFPCGGDGVIGMPGAGGGGGMLPTI